MLDVIESILRDECRLNKDRPILVGVSGGPDSLCLLGTLQEAGWQTIAAHFNHRLRPEADEDAAAVESIAGRLGIPFVGGGEDVQRYAAASKLSIEAAARELRYRFLFTQARQHGTQAVAVGHTADDQVETVFMHFVRGAGLNGLSGMTYRTVLQVYDPDIPLVRPLLDVWRAQTISYCEAHQLQPRYDASNESREFIRNRLRHDLIPSLEAYNPRFRQAVLRASKTLAADRELLVDLLQPLWQESIARLADRYVALRPAFLSGQPAALQRHILRRAVEHLLPALDLGYEDLQRGVAFLADAAQDRVDLLGGLILLREADVLYLTASESALPSSQWPQMPNDTDSLHFSSPCTTSLAEGWQFSCSRCDDADKVAPASWDGSDPYEALIEAQGLSSELELRTRRSGDRFEPLGMDGHSQKLSDFFVNVKLPARARDRWPLVCDGDRVIWVPGYRPAHSVRLRPESRTVLRLVMRRPINKDVGGL